MIEEDIPTVQIYQRIYEIELEAIKTYTNIFSFNQDCFNNFEYISWYENSNRKLESEFIKKSDQVIKDCESNAYKLNREILENSYHSLEQSSKDVRIYHSALCE